MIVGAVSAPPEGRLDKTVDEGHMNKTAAFPLVISGKVFSSPYTTSPAPSNRFMKGTGYLHLANANRSVVAIASAFLTSSQAETTLPVGTRSEAGNLVT